MVLSILSSFSVTEIMLFKSEVSNRNLRKVGVYSKGDSRFAETLVLGVTKRSLPKQ